MHAVELGDGGVEQLLVPALELVDPLDRPGRVGLQVLDDHVDVGAGFDAFGDLAHGVLDAVQLVPPPRVGLVEVELHAVEVLRVHRVALAPDRVVLVGVWRVLLDEEPPQRGVRLGGAGCQALEAVAEGAVAVSRRVVLVDEGEEERTGRAVEPAPRVGLLRARDGLAPRRHDALGRAFGERGLDAREPLGHQRQALGDDLPVVGRVPGHEVEGHAYRLHRAAEHPQVAQALAGVVLDQAELEPLAHDLGRDPVGIVADVDGVEGAQRGAVVLGPFGATVGGVVGHLVVVAGDALARRRERVQRGEALDVLFGQLVHRRGHVRPPLSPLRPSRLDCSASCSGSRGERSCGTADRGACCTPAARCSRRPRRRPAARPSTERSASAGW